MQDCAVPIVSNFADWFSYPLEFIVPAHAAAIPPPAFARVEVIGSSYFVLQAFRAAVLAPVEGAGGQPLSSGFSATIQRHTVRSLQQLDEQQIMFTASSFLAGEVVKIPVVYYPQEQFNVILRPNSGPTIATWKFYLALEGYHVPRDNWEQFQSYFPNLVNAACL